jgi:hypothetical protein
VHGFFNGLYIEGIVRVGYASMWEQKTIEEDVVAKELA